MSTWARTAGISATAAALAVLATSALVSAQGAGQQPIQACADSRGTLRLVQPTETCLAGESRVTWIVQGPPGPLGPAGAVGPRGLKGKTGPKGKIKLKGVISPEAGLVLNRLAKLDKKVTGLGNEVSKVKQTVLFNKGFLKGHHTVEVKTKKTIDQICHNLDETYARLYSDHHDGSGPLLGLVACP